MDESDTEMVTEMSCDYRDEKNDQTDLVDDLKNFDSIIANNGGCYPEDDDDLIGADEKVVKIRKSIPKLKIIDNHIENYANDITEKVFSDVQNEISSASTERIKSSRKDDLPTISIDIPTITITGDAIDDSSVMLSQCTLQSRSNEDIIDDLPDDDASNVTLFNPAKIKNKIKRFGTKVGNKVGSKVRVMFRKRKDDHLEHVSASSHHRIRVIRISNLD